jgi:hypothetical protein
MVWQAIHPFRWEMTLVQTCTVCGQSKEAAEFGFRNRATGRRHRRCKTCVAEYGRKHYAANRTIYVTRNNQRSRTQTLELKTRVQQYLLEHPCVECGVAEPLLLDFDHVDRATKRKSINKLVRQAYSWQAVEAEIEKCQVRCANCHRRRTAVQFAWEKLTYALGDGAKETVSVFKVRSHLRRPGRPGTSASVTRVLSAQIIAAGFRVCGWCGAAKLAEQFHLRKKETGERHSICGECFAAYRQEHYRLNREAYVQRNARIQRERGRMWSRRVWEFLCTHPCVDCGESDPIVLECDHIDPTGKRETVGYLARGGYPWATVLAELGKCEIRCANCHRKRTALQFDWLKLRPPSA